MDVVFHRLVLFFSFKDCGSAASSACHECFRHQLSFAPWDHRFPSYDEMPFFFFPFSFSFSFLCFAFAQLSMGHVVVVGHVRKARKAKGKKDKGEGGISECDKTGGSPVGIGLGCAPGTRVQMVGASSSSGSSSSSSPSLIVLVHVKAVLSQAWDHTAAICLLAGVLGYVKPGGLLSSAFALLYFYFRVNELAQLRDLGHSQYYYFLRVSVSS